MRETLKAWLEEFAITHCGVPFEELEGSDQVAVYDALRVQISIRQRHLVADRVSEAKRELRRPSKVRRND